MQKNSTNASIFFLVQTRRDS